MSLRGLTDIPQSPFLSLIARWESSLSSLRDKAGEERAYGLLVAEEWVGGLLTEEAIEALDGLVEASTVDLVVQDGLHLRVVDL